MLTCRTIPPAQWEHARRVLVFYFSRRHLRANAEDLAQDTLAALLHRDDFEFEREEDFLRVCHAFARLVIKAGYRREFKHAATELDDHLAAAPERNAFGLSATEMAVFLQEVLKAGKSELSQRDWEIIQRNAVPEDPEKGAAVSEREANRNRVRLHRARKKLAQLTGWTKTSL